MKHAALTIGLLLVAGAPAFAQENLVAAREQLMRSNVAAAQVAGGMMKGEIPYSPAVGKSVIMTFDATALAFGEFFPEGSTSPGAAPKIWSDRAGFDAEIAKFQEASGAAVELSGRPGPADLAAFQTAVGPILDTCKSCHEGYRIDD